MRRKYQTQKEEYLRFKEKYKKLKTSMLIHCFNMND